jgi:hypothetical protein
MQKVYIETSVVSYFVGEISKNIIIATWNFKHINNPFTKNKIKQIIEDVGFSCPVLASPEELLGEDS